MKELSEKKIKISRVTRSGAEAEASYDRKARTYDFFEGHFEQRFGDIALGKLGAKEGEIILEIGFGTGHSLVKLARSVGDSGKVYGVDISERMLEVTRSRVEREGLTHRVELIKADASKLPLEPDFFSAVFMSFTLELFDTPLIPVVLNECQWVLQDGGRICVLSVSKTGNDAPATKLYEWLHTKFPKFLDCRPIPVKEVLQDAGFQSLSVIDVSVWGLPAEIVIAKKATLP